MLPFTLQVLSSAERTVQSASEQANNTEFMAILELLLVLTVIPGCLFASADVITLSDATFADKVKEKDTAWFINFCVPWCKHCKRMDSLWEELGKDIEAEDEVEIARVDCTLSKPTCVKVDIRSYPTLKLFYNGEDIEKYTGPRDLEALKKFALEAALKLAREDMDADQA
eukprot:c23065_g1_i2 orf=188-697(+)